MTGDTTLFILSFLTAASFLAFLYYNWSPATVFMGDTGSLNAGLILAYLGMQYLNTSLQTPELVYFQSSAPVILVAVFIIPLYDTLRVFRSEEHTSELQSRGHLVCRLLL